MEQFLADPVKHFQALRPMPTLEDALALAAHAHRGQRYPSPTPEPFILHPLRLMLQFDTLPERIVAVLHDLEVAVEALEAVGFHRIATCRSQARYGGKYTRWLPFAENDGFGRER
jgi:hypothetical protein